MRRNKQSPQIGSFASFLREQALAKKLFDSVNSNKSNQKAVCEELYRKNIGRTRQEVQDGRNSISRTEVFTASSGHIGDQVAKKHVHKDFLLSAKTRERNRLKNQILEYEQELVKGSQPRLCGK